MFSAIVLKQWFKPITKLPEEVFEYEISESKIKPVDILLCSMPFNGNNLRIGLSSVYGECTGGP